MLLHRLAQASQQVAATRSRLAKVAALADALRDASGPEVEIAASYLGGALRQRRTGLGYRSVQRMPPSAAEPALDITEVDAIFEEMGGLAGPGSQTRRSALLADLLGRATELEQRYLAGLITGELRQGALDGLLVDAVAAAAEVPVPMVRRAAMLAGSTPAIAQAALTGGAPALAQFDLTVGVAVRPMLASSAPNLAEALPKASPTGQPVSVEAKLDGIRIQVHKDASGVRVFSRSLDEITARLPDVVAIVAALPVRTAILDGEALSIDETGRPRLFQDTASSSATTAAPAWRLTPWFFDALLLDDEPLIDRPLVERRAALAQVIPTQYLIEAITTADVEQATDFAERVLTQGHEGVVVKDLAASYEAGRRGAGWVKVKPVHTLDLVVLAVEWGSGRRRGKLSNIHLGARDPETGVFVMLGKTFKGMTDQMLDWQTQRFLELETGRDDYTVHVRPEQVVEIAFDGLQRSRRYPGGLALRFARVVRYRDDKSADQADTIESVRALADVGVFQSLSR